MILFWFCFLRAGTWLVLKKGLKVMCLKMIIKSCLHPAVFKTVYKNAETGEMVMECSSQEVGLKYLSVWFCSVAGVACSSVHWFCKPCVGVQFHGAVPSDRQLSAKGSSQPCTGCEAPDPSLGVWHSSHHRWWFKMPFLSRFSAVLVKAITCCGTSAR